MSLDVELDREQLLEAMQRDCIVFLSFYLGEQLTLTIPKFHIEIWGEMLDLVEKVNNPNFILGHLQKLFSVPREHSKSTLVKLATVLFLRYSRLGFLLYASKTAPIALQACKDIVSYFRSANDAALYGESALEKSNDTEMLWILTIWLPTGVQKRILIKGVGRGHQIRGTLIENQRPDLLIFDDIEDNDTADQGDQQKKTDAWAMGSAIKATSARSLRIFIGNMINSKTLLARLSSDPDWNPTNFGCLVRDKETGELKPLWEGKHTVESLLADYRKYRKLGLGHLWEAEMMNLSNDKLLGESLDNALTVPLPNPEELTAGFICLDPAFGVNSWNDESAITVHARIMGLGIPCLIQSRKGRWKEESVLDNLIELSYYWNISTWCIESIAAQRLLIPLFRLLMKDRQMNPDVFSILPITAGKEQKSSRIVTFRKSVSTQNYALCEQEGDLRMRLEEYSPESKTHDDLCDSGAFGPIVWETYGDMIEYKGITSIAGQLMQLATAHAENKGELDVCAY